MLLNHPAVQDRIHAELDEAVGKDTQVTLDHRDLLVYTEAVILETQRMYPLVPFAAPHMCTKDATIGGYLLTKGDKAKAQGFSQFVTAVHFAHEFLRGAATVIRKRHGCPFCLI